MLATKRWGVSHEKVRAPNKCYPRKMEAAVWASWEEMMEARISAILSTQAKFKEAVSK